MSSYTKESDWKISEVCSVKIDSLKKKVSEFYDEWLIDTSRQENYVVHENTFMYELLQFDYNWRPGQVAVPVKKNALTGPALVELVKIYNFLEAYVDGVVVHAEIISMNPKSRIRIHKDRGDMLYVARRFHAPLKTNSETFFIVDDETFYLSEGFLYELNNIKYHGVRNNSNEARIHLIIDVIPNIYIG